MNGIFQHSTVGALAAGLDDGTMTIGALLRHGTFGLGTFDALDGEMIILDGTCHHLHADGTVTPATDDDTTPFAVITEFAPSLTLPLPAGSTTRTELIELLESHLPGDNYFYAIRIDGYATKVTTRTVRKQHKPYPSLLAAAHGESVQTFDQVRGTFVGFRSPDYVGTITVAGYHLHFIDDERTRGGHVLDFVLAEGAVAVDKIRDFRLRLPDGPQFAATELTGAQTVQDIAAAEGSRPP